MAEDVVGDRRVHISVANRDICIRTDRSRPLLRIEAVLLGVVRVRQGDKAIDVDPAIADTFVKQVSFCI
jgi:hypothetical protein